MIYRALICVEVVLHRNGLTLASPVFLHITQIISNSLCGLLEMILVSRFLASDSWWHFYCFQFSDKHANPTLHHLMGPTYQGYLYVDKREQFWVTAVSLGKLAVVIFIISVHSTLNNKPSTQTQRTKDSTTC
jgi:hypothetical protein